MCREKKVRKIFIIRNNFKIMSWSRLLYRIIIFSEFAVKFYFLFFFIKMEQPPPILLPETKHTVLQAKYGTKMVRNCLAKASHKQL